MNNQYRQTQFNRSFVTTFQQISKYTLIYSIQAVKFLINFIAEMGRMVAGK